MPWSQPLDPLGNPWLSTTVAAIPVLLLLGLVAWGRIRVSIAALLALGAAVSVALVAFRMPIPAALGAAVYGGAYGLFPIGWIVLNVMFLHAQVHSRIDHIIASYWLLIIMKRFYQKHDQIWNICFV